MGISNWVISKRADRYLIVFENANSFTQVSMTEGQYRKFVIESEKALGMDQP